MTSRCVVRKPTVPGRSVHLYHGPLLHPDTSICAPGSLRLACMVGGNANLKKSLVRKDTEKVEGTRYWCDYRFLELVARLVITCSGWWVGVTAQQAYRCKLIPQLLPRWPLACPAWFLDSDSISYQRAGRRAIHQTFSVFAHSVSSTDRSLVADTTSSDISGDVPACSTRAKEKDSH